MGRNPYTGIPTKSERLEQQLYNMTIKVLELSLKYDAGINYILKSNLDDDTKEKMLLAFGLDKAGRELKK